MLSSKIQQLLKQRLNKIYRPVDRHIDINFYHKELVQLINSFNKKHKKRKKINISEKTTLLITYGDSVTQNAADHTLKHFKKFFSKYLSNYFNAIHFLPFYPSSSDSGFAVKDHYKIDRKIGSWKDISSLSKTNLIMADIVINHASSRGLWFKNYLRNNSPGKDYFLTVDHKFNTNKVIRPRDHKLLKKIKLFNKTRYLWRTFSADQIDLNFKNPRVLMRNIKILINLLSHGTNVFRLDAIAYLWKESGTKCVNLKQTHEIIKFIKLVGKNLKSESILVTETNLPEKENLSYFGKGDEANWIYNFSLPPLLVHALSFEDSSKLLKWSRKLPQAKKGTSYLNFIASHDGIGMRPAEGILNNKTLNTFFRRIKKNGGEFSYRKIQKARKKIYEANITIFNALEKTDKDPKAQYSFERYITAHAIMISFEGIPAIYLNSIFGTPNDFNKYIVTNNKRDLNRYKWNKKKLEKKLKNKHSKQYKFYKEITRLLLIRKNQKAFHPNAIRKTIKSNKNFFMFKRISLDKKQTVTCIFNLTSKIQNLNLDKKSMNLKNLLNDQKLCTINNKIQIEPFQTLWLSN